MSGGAPNGLWAELKRRRVVRVAVVYVVAALAVLQAADPLASALNLPPWTLSFVVFLALLGFPVALALAWAFELTPEGLRRTRRRGAGVSTPHRPRRAPGFVGAGLLIALIAFGAYLRSPSHGTTASPTGDSAAPLPAGGEGSGLASIAVLWCEDMSPQRDQAYFSDGIAEEIIHALVRVPGLKVPARTSSFAFKGRNLDARAIGDSLGVDAVLECSVRKEGDRLRITAQLVGVGNGFPLWSDRYDRQFTGVFQVQEEIARAIVTALRVPLGLESAAELVPHRTENVDAYDGYLEARNLFNARGPGVQAAVTLLEDVVAREPAFVPAWALMAETYAVLVYFAGSDERGFVTDPDAAVNMMRRAQQAAERAIALDSLYAPAHAAMGTVARERLDWTAAERHLRRAIELDPKYAEGHSNLGEILFALDRVDEAREHHLHAIALEPRTFIYRWNMAWLAYRPNLNDATLEHLRVADQILPNSPNTTVLIALNYAALRRFREARDAVRATPTLPSPVREALLTLLADLEAGRQTEAGREALRVLPSSPSHWLLYGDTAGAAGHALDLAVRYPYFWGGFLGGLPELMDYPDFREARLRKNLPVRE